MPVGGGWEWITEDVAFRFKIQSLGSSQFKQYYVHSIFYGVLCDQHPLHYKWYKSAVKGSSAVSQLFSRFPHSIWYELVPISILGGTNQLLQTSSAVNQLFTWWRGARFHVTPHYHHEQALEDESETVEVSPTTFTFSHSRFPLPPSSVTCVCLASPPSSPKTRESLG